MPTQLISFFPINPPSLDGDGDGEEPPLGSHTPIAAAVRFSTTQFILYRLSPQADQNSLTWNAHNAPNPPCTWSVLVVETFLNLSKGCLYGCAGDRLLLGYRRQSQSKLHSGLLRMAARGSQASPRRLGSISGFWTR